MLQYCVYGGCVRIDDYLVVSVERFDKAEEESVSFIFKNNRAKGKQCSND